MSDDANPVDFQSVQLHELDEIVKRRREANIPVEKDEDGLSQFQPRSASVAVSKRCAAAC